MNSFEGFEIILVKILLPFFLSNDHASFIRTHVIFLPSLNLILDTSNL